MCVDVKGSRRSFSYLCSSAKFAGLKTLVENESTTVGNVNCSSCSISGKVTIDSLFCVVILVKRYLQVKSRLGFFADVAVFTPGELCAVGRHG